MKKYYVYFDDLCDEKPAPQPGFTDHEVYLASDVYATISELASALREVVDAYYDVDNKERLAEAIHAAHRVL